MTRKKPSAGQPDQPAKPATLSPEPAEETTVSAPGPAKGFPIVGIGASAGGLAAFEAFFSTLPAEAGNEMAFVLVQHLSPDHKSLLSDLLRRHTRMQIHEVEDGMQVQPGRAYIIPPNRDMALIGGGLQLLEPSSPRGQRLPIDFFFRSLAQDQHERAICIVLSGTGSDGTLGMRAIKGEGGMVMVQEPDSTEYDGMPRNAIATGLVDYVLPPDEMAAQLIAYVAHAFGKGERLPIALFPKAEDGLKKLCVLLRDRTGHDFSQYKENTLVRRIERRMALHQIERPGDYLRFVQQKPGELDALFRDLLIGVTNFFRDPEAFAALEQRIIPRLFAVRPSGAPIRVWVCGCSTGEEAYSIAILLQEYLETLRQAFKVQVFATDIDPLAIERARSGIYPASIAADISPERLARFFVQDANGGSYRIQKTIRDLLVFSEQDLVKDPPFSRLDLISCRNLLIYMNGDLQKRLIPLFHYALNPGGSLFLGTSETIGEFSSLFSALDRKWKLYRRQVETPGTAYPSLGHYAPPPLQGSAPSPRPMSANDRLNPRELTEQTLLEHYAQAGVLINGRGDILYIHGRTGQYLEPAAGNAGMNILGMAREGLRRDLSSALHRVVTLKTPVRCPGLRVRTNGCHISADLVLRPLTAGPDKAPPADLYLVILETRADEPERPSPDIPEAEAHSDSDRRIAALELELKSKEEYLQSTLEEMETSNEELKSTNEEMQSVNEELQSTNEELETSKEELQSVNEELATVNAELQTKLTDLSRANNDMNNLMAGTGVASLFVDLQLRITRFTPAATQIINLIPTDVGRPVGHIVSNLEGYDRLIEDLRTVLDNLSSLETEVRTKQGAWYLMRIRPYRTLENVIEGAVITFMEITERKRMDQALQRASALNQQYLDTVQTIMVALNPEGRIAMINRRGCELLGYREEEDLRGRNWFQTCLPQPEGMERVYPVFQRLMEGDLETGEYVENPVLCRDGSQRLIAWHNAPLLDGEGVAIGTLS
ncbi:MAG: chemotaxis protein CheR, partial [Gammaproteobacteria bacterium RIFOXYA12_FULL_61_12]